jgi:hypothetical protein
MAQEAGGVVHVKMRTVGGARNSLMDYDGMLSRRLGSNQTIL